jgi:hypothetical protein
MRTVRCLRWLFVVTVAASILFPSLVRLGASNLPQHGWSKSAGDVLWLTALFAPCPALLAWYGYRAVSKAERGMRGWPEPPVLGGAAVGALIVSALQLVDSITDPTSGIIIAIPGMLLALQTVGALAGAVIAAVAQKLLSGHE